MPFGVNAHPEGMQDPSLPQGVTRVPHRTNDDDVAQVADLVDGARVDLITGGQLAKAISPKASDRAIAHEKKRVVRPTLDLGF